MAVYAQVYSEDYPYACQTAAMRTLFSIVLLYFLYSQSNFRANIHLDVPVSQRYNILV